MEAIKAQAQARDKNEKRHKHEAKMKARVRAAQMVLGEPLPMTLHHSLPSWLVPRYSLGVADLSGLREQCWETEDTNHCSHTFGRLVELHVLSPARLKRYPLALLSLKLADVAGEGIADDVDAGTLFSLHALKVCVCWPFNVRVNWACGQLPEDTSTHVRLSISPCQKRADSADQIMWDITQSLSSGASRTSYRA